MRLALALLIVAAFVTCCPLMNSGALKKAERLAQRLKAQPGFVDGLRHWFSQMASTARSTNTPSSDVTIPEPLRSEPMSGARARGFWSNNSLPERITVTPDMYEFITIGPPAASAGDLKLTRGAGEPPAFYAKVADGIYTWIRYK
jgi:hypothetical protein